MEQKIRRDRNMGDNLRRLRGDAGLSQEKLCAELQRRGCDIGRTTYAKIWISKLGKYNETMFFDCHAGCGAYIDQETSEVTYGSSFFIQ